MEVSNVAKSLASRLQQIVTNVKTSKTWYNSVWERIEEIKIIINWLNAEDCLNEAEFSFLKEELKKTKEELQELGL